MHAWMDLQFVQLDLALQIFPTSIGSRRDRYHVERRNEKSERKKKLANLAV